MHVWRETKVESSWEGREICWSHNAMDASELWSIPSASNCSRGHGWGEQTSNKAAGIGLEQIVGPTKSSVLSSSSSSSSSHKIILPPTAEDLKFHSQYRSPTISPITPLGPDLGDQTTTHTSITKAQSK